MKQARFWTVSAVFLCLAACDQGARDSGPAPHHGRYVGIGVFAVGNLWPLMVDKQAARDPANATIRDDEHVIVTVDSDTGEIRECGDYSGRCVAMNPWTKAIAAEQAAPVRLTKHEEDLAREQGAPPPPAKAGQPARTH